MRVYFIGICGISMSALAYLASKFGMKVCGSDIDIINLPKCLQGISVNKFPCFEKLEGYDIVVYSSAIKDDNLELIFARNKGKKIVSRGEFLAMISSNFEKVIAISGSHGKTTTTAMIYHTLYCAGKAPTLHAGGILKDLDMQVEFGESEYFITEACEYFDNFLFLKPYISVITNIEPEHLDYFKTFENQKESFKQFEKNSEICIKKTEFQAKNIAINKDGDISFSIFKNDNKLDKIKMRIGGKYNVKNALFCAEVCEKLGLNFCQIKLGLETFKGVKKRCEKIETKFDFSVVVDYAHHPKEIQEFSSYISSFHKGKKVLVFQPHTYSRTDIFFDDFVKSFENFDEIILFKTFAAREKKQDGKSEIELFEKLKQDGKKAYVFFDVYLLEQFLIRYKKDDLVCFCGAGDLPELLHFN